MIVADSADAAVADVVDGATVLVGGFGMAGMPVVLIDALIRQGATGLTVVSINAGNGDTGLAAFLAKGRVRKVICSPTTCRTAAGWCSIPRTGCSGWDRTPTPTTSTPT